VSNKVVIGALFGDEGKGAVTEYLCSQDPENSIVVRFSGGHQCGHKVMKGDVEHIFSNFGSGTLSGCPTYWSELCTFEPVGFMRELALLKKKGAQPTIYIHPDCPVTTIYDVLANRSGVEREHGTTGTGFGKTKKRHFDGGPRLTVKELLYSLMSVTSSKLKEIKEYYSSEDLDENVFLDAVFSIKRCMSLSGRVIVRDTIPIPSRKHKIFEGSQGLMLDPSIGTMPHCTPSNLTPRNILGMGYSLDEIYLVTRAYQTRHGNGPMTNEKHALELINTEKETNHCNTYQGEFRKSILDVEQLIYAKTKGIDEIVPRDTKVNLVVTCIDQVGKPKLTTDISFREFASSESFVKYIGKHLGINGDLYINDSPYSKSIKKIT
jgi:adenylosuccinate synthase